MKFSPEFLFTKKYFQSAGMPPLSQRLIHSHLCWRVALSLVF
jgi:hypothetical protein